MTLFGEYASTTTRGVKRNANVDNRKAERGMENGEQLGEHARSYSQRGSEEGRKVKLNEIGREEKRGCCNRCGGNEIPAASGGKC